MVFFQTKAFVGKAIMINDFDQKLNKYPYPETTFHWLLYNSFMQCPSHKSHVFSYAKLFHIKVRDPQIHIIILMILVSIESLLHPISALGI